MQRSTDASTPACTVALSPKAIASNSALQSPQASPRSQIPIASAAPPPPTSRDFVPWRFSDAGRHSAWMASSSRRPRNLHRSRHLTLQSSDLRPAGEFSCGSSLTRPPIPKDAHLTAVGRDRQSDGLQFGSKNRSAKTNAATEVLATASCLGAFHEENPSAGPVPVGSSLKQCHFFARKASSGAKRSANGVRRHLQLSQLYVRDELRLVWSMRRPMHG